MGERTIVVGGQTVRVFDDEITGTQVKELLDISAADQGRRQIVRQHPDGNTLVPDHTPIRIDEGNVFTHHARHIKGSGSVRRQRLRSELAILSRAYPLIQHDADFSWITIEGFRLPKRWRPDVTTIGIEPPALYPEVGPYGVFLGGGLQYRQGGTWHKPGHYFKLVPYEGQKERYRRWNDAGYHWYCMHDDDGNWNPGYDSLITFVNAVWSYMEDPS